MKIDYAPRALEALEEAPTAIRRTFFKQARLLRDNLRHPSIRAKKYDQSRECMAGPRQSRLAILLLDQGRHDYRSGHYSASQIISPPF
jgi:hypothetical protein